MVPGYQNVRAPLVLLSEMLPFLFPPDIGIKFEPFLYIYDNAGL